MRAKARFRCVWVALLLLVLSAAACKQSSGTFVVLTFQGTVPAGSPIHSIGVSLQLGTRSDSTFFQAPGGSVITLPTDATLQIGSGSGDLTVSATALAENQTPLATGTAHGRVTNGQTTKIILAFGGTGGDAGTDGPADAQPDGALANKDAGADGPTTVADAAPPDTVPFAIDTADSGSGKSDASPDGSGGAGDVSGGTGGGATGGAGGTASSAGGTAGNGAGGTAGSGAGGTASGGSSGAFQLSLTVAALDFGVVPMGSVSAPQTLTVTNAGGGTSPSLMLFVNDGHHFPVFQDRCSGAVLMPGNTCTVTFTFNPSDATGSMQTDGSVGPAQGPSTKFTLAGTASNGTAILTLSPSSVDFKNLDVGISSSVPFTVTNNGTADSGAVKILVNPVSAFQIANDGCSAVTLGKLGQCTFSLVFAPQTLGPVSATIAAQSTSGLVATSSATGVGQDHVQLTIQFAGTGGGSVTGSNLNCLSGTACTVGITRTDPSSMPTVNLSALANSSSLFSGWSSPCSGTGNCSIVMDAARTVTATFDAVPVQISLNVLALAGQQGTLVSDDGSITCGSSCPALVHAANANFTLIAKPGANSSFVGWTDGPCRGTSPKCTFALTGPTIVSATFGPQSYMFVSSSTIVPGKLGGIAVADKECQRLASNASLPGSYQAWLSATGINGRSRVGVGGWVRTDGRPFAKNLASLTSPSAPTVYYPPRLDEMGNDIVSSYLYVATGGDPSGMALGSQCSDYTNPTGSLYMGNAANGSLGWAMNVLDSAGCSQPYHIYCFRSDGLGTDLVPPPQPGRRIFLSAKAFVPGSSVSPDKSCQSEATAANLANASQFIAFISTSTTPALKRLSASGLPWKRVDDVFVVRQMSDFAGGKLLAPLGLFADGSQYSSANVWTGASDPSVVGSGTCQDWSTNSTTFQGLVGGSDTTAIPDWFDVAPTSCDSTTNHLICIEP